MLYHLKNKIKHSVVLPLSHLYNPDSPEVHPTCESSVRTLEPCGLLSSGTLTGCLSPRVSHWPPLDALLVEKALVQHLCEIEI